MSYEGVFGPQDVAAAPAASLVRRDHVAGRTTAAEVARERRVATPPREPAGPVGADARARLAPELLALLDPSVSARPLPDVVDGRVDVKVRLGEMSRRAIDRLEALGLRVRIVTRGLVVGSVALADLARPVETESVLRIEPAWPTPWKKLRPDPVLARGRAAR